MSKTSLFIALLAVAGSTYANAGDLSIKIGGFYALSDASMNVSNPDIDESYTLDFESDLGLTENQFLPFFEINYQFFEKHHIYLDWKQLHRNSEIDGVTRPFEIEIDDIVYNVQAGGKLATTLNIDIARISYGYDLFQGSDYNLGFLLGFHIMSIDTAFEGTIAACASTELVNNVCSSTPIPRVVEESVTAPLPDIGVYGSFEMLPGWQFIAHAQYFYVKVDNFQGSLVDLQAGIEAKITENWRMSVAYNYYKVNVDIEENGENNAPKVTDFNVNYSFVGPMLAVSYTF
ncbi:DUF481 domain-containing protein [Shewanella sp. KJ2020]|uniref:DUF481 domain-containing protein n=1 Tax=Shewanella sp. KJ2020 TaxID=2919172 RepID=UPI0020A7D8A4|nr:DUF481 domain-containing protein [Shewanella sp. KJ2020]MCP3128271.1 hypothetical protein [Shewanella sp. KJ2020]